MLWIILTCKICSAQPSIAWQHNYGGSVNEFPGSIQPTNDGGFVVLANTYSNDGQVTGQHGQLDLWVVKLDENGELEWQSCFGSSGNDFAGDIRQTPDGGFLIIGSANTVDGDVSNTAGSSDIWVVKLNATGNLDWEKSYGGSLPEIGRWLHLLPNGEVLLFGETFSPEIEGAIGDRDAWVVRIAEDGTQLQQRRYGGTMDDLMGYSAYFSNGSLIFSGATNSNDGDAEGNHGGGDGMVLSLDENLNVNWHTCIGGSSHDNAIANCTSGDGSIYVGVIALSLDGQITNARGAGDFWIVKLSPAGEFLAQGSFGGSALDGLWSILPAQSGGAYALGFTFSTDVDVSDPKGAEDVWLIKVDEDLQLVWELSLGGTSGDRGYSMCFAPDGGLVLACGSASSDGGLTGNFGGGDLWVVKFNPEEVGITESGLSPFSLTVTPNPATDRVMAQWSNFYAKSVEVFDARGRIVFRKDQLRTEQRSLEFPAQNWDQGLYTVCLRTATDRITQRFIKQ